MGRFYHNSSSNILGIYWRFRSFCQKSPEQDNLDMGKLLKKKKMYSIPNRMNLLLTDWRFCPEGLSFWVIPQCEGGVREAWEARGPSLNIGLWFRFYCRLLCWAQSSVEFIINQDQRIASLKQTQQPTPEDPFLLLFTLKARIFFEFPSVLQTLPKVVFTIHIWTPKGQLMEMFDYYRKWTLATLKYTCNRKTGTSKHKQQRELFKVNNLQFRSLNYSPWTSKSDFLRISLLAFSLNWRKEESAEMFREECTSICNYLEIHKKITAS